METKRDVFILLHILLQIQYHFFPLKNLSLLLRSGRLPCIPTILSVGKCKTYYIHYVVCIYTLLCIIMHKGCGREADTACGAADCCISLEEYLIGPSVVKHVMNE